MEVSAKKVLLRSEDNEYLVPYTGLEETKADVDFGNVDPELLRRLSPNMMPNYKAKVQRSHGTTYTETTAGWVYIQHGSNDGESGWVYIDGVQLGTWQWKYVAQTYTIFPVPLGSSWSSSGTGAVYWIPCVG